jgi:hypothetical protein
MQDVYIHPPWKQNITRLALVGAFGCSQNVVSRLVRREGLSNLVGVFLVVGDGSEGLQTCGCIPCCW